MKRGRERMVFTQKAIEKLPVLKERAHYYDKDIRGFGLRVEASGRKSFFFFVKANGKPEFRSLGQFPDIDVQKAREAAKLWAGRLSNWKLTGFEGPSPFEKEKRTNAPTFQQLIDAYVERHVKQTANRPEHAEANVRWIVKKHFSGWLARPIDSIGIEDVLLLKNEVGKEHKYMANRLVETVRCVFNWSAANREGKVNFWPAQNPAKDIEFFKEKTRDRFLQPDELLKFNAALEKEPHRDLRDFLKLALATGARKSDILGARWTDIKFELLTWHVPTSKSGAYDVSLTPAALEVLERRRKEIPDSIDFVFPSHSKCGHVTDLKKAWDKFRKRAGIPDVRLHDMRRTRGSYLAISGASLQQIGRALGHRSLGSTQIYARLHDSAVRKALEAGDQTMERMMAEARKRMKRQARKPKLLAAVANG